MNNIWVKCYFIAWDSNSEHLPKSVDELVIAPEWVIGDNHKEALVNAINNKLSEEYNANASCLHFSIYDDNEARELDLKLLTGCCHK